MIIIYKIIDGIESEVHCTTQEGAEAMVKSNPDKYSFEKRVNDESVVRNDSELIKKIEELEAENSALKEEVEALKAIIDDLQSGILSDKEPDENEIPDLVDDSEIAETNLGEEPVGEVPAELVQDEE